MVACDRRRTLDQLVKWYTDGWQWWGVKCEYLGFEDSVWGIDDDEYAENEVRVEIACEVAHQMQEAGFTVNGVPDRKAEYRSNRIWHIRRNQHGQNWKGN